MAFVFQEALDDVRRLLLWNVRRQNIEMIGSGLVRNNGPNFTN
jgi:hypothetical protein